MKRRLFLLSGTASAALALTACGGGGGETDPTSDLLSGRKRKTTTTTTPTTTTTTPTTDTTSTGTTAAAVAYPFGARLNRYVAGTVKPSKTDAEMDAQLKKHYDAWKAARVVSATQIVAGGYAIQMPDTTFLCVSEGQGYGMLITVIFAGYDPNAQAIFDGLFKVVRARPAYAVQQYDANGKYLMDWRLYANGTSAGDGWNAMDGDEDIAMALLMADKQWGSAGAINYLQEARNTIAAMKSWNMAADGTTKGQAKGDCSRTSDYMIGHFRAFQAATGDAFWAKAVDRAYELTNLMQTTFAPQTGLMPEFIVKTNTTAPIPSPDYYTEGRVNEDAYGWNACRVPWRFAADYLLSGDTRWKTATSRMADFFAAKVAGPDGIYAVECSYELDGTVLQGGDSAAFIAPVMAAGCVDAKYQSMVDQAWAWGLEHMETGYYDSEIQLLCEVLVSGNWWRPA